MLRRNLQQRQSCHWDHRLLHSSLSNRESVARKSSFHNVGGGNCCSPPSSLPPLFTLNQIPRAPIPTPLDTRKQSVSSSSSSSVESEKNGDKSHYEVLKNKKEHNISGSSRRSSDNNASSTFDSVEIQFGDDLGRNASGNELYKVLHDRDGDYSYAYDTRYAAF